MLHWMVHLKGPRRASHAAVAVRHKVYSFGGYCDGETYRYNGGQIDVHVFNTVSLRWARLPRVTSGRAERPVEVPSMRYGHTAVLIEDIVYIWGGSTYTREDSKELYAFDVDAHGWFKPWVSGPVPVARRSHSACVLGKVMYIYGGYNQLTGCTNDIYKLDTATMVWSLVNTRGTTPPVSFYHSATSIGTKMFVFGGHGDQFENISVFDTETDCWLSSSSAQLLPEGRGVHSAFAYDSELYIFTSYPMTTFVDLWKFNPASLSWKKVEPKGKNPSSWMSRMCCCMVGDRVFLFAGYNLDDLEGEDDDDDEDELSDLYILDLSPSLKTLCKLAVIQCGLERSGLPHDIRWELAAMATSSHRHRKHNVSVLSASEAAKNQFSLCVCQQAFMAVFVVVWFHFYTMLL